MYTPDRWLLVSLRSNLTNSTIIKILAGWYGGYTQGDSWRLSSGVTSILDEGDFYTITNESGSVYKCFKSEYGTTSYSGLMFQKFEADLGDKGSLHAIDEGAIQTLDLFKENE